MINQEILLTESYTTVGRRVRNIICVSVTTEIAKMKKKKQKKNDEEKENENEGQEEDQREEQRNK